MNSLLNILGLLGLGSIIGIVTQYFISKRTIRYEKILETKLILARRVYRQVYYVYALCHEEFSDLEHSSGVDISVTCHNSGLSIQSDLGELLFYANGELKESLERLIYTIYIENGIFGKSDHENMKKILDELKKLVKV